MNIFIEPRGLHLNCSWITSKSISLNLILNGILLPSTIRLLQRFSSQMIIAFSLSAPMISQETREIDSQIYVNALPPFHPRLVVIDLRCLVILIVC